MPSGYTICYNLNKYLKNLFIFELPAIMSACCVYLPSTRAGGGGREEKTDGWGLAQRRCPVWANNTQHWVREALHKNPWFHLPVLLGRSEHLSELSPSSTRGVPACLCPARRHQRTDSTVSDGGYMHQDAVFLLYHNTDLSLQSWRRCSVRTQVASRWSVGAYWRAKCFTSFDVILRQTVLWENTAQ